MYDFRTNPVFQPCKDFDRWHRSRNVASNFSRAVLGSSQSARSSELRVENFVFVSVVSSLGRVLEMLVRIANRMTKSQYCLKR